MVDELFGPGTQVPESGVYQVFHYRHRLSHEVTLMRGAYFQRCSECRDNVRFRLVRSAPVIRLDRNFRNFRSLRWRGAS